MRIAAISGVALLAACTSYQSELVTENEHGAFTKTRLSGVPIVVTVPQKLGFLVTETTYEIATPTRNPDGTTGNPTISHVTETTIDKSPIPLGDSRLVTLDIRRPFFGTAKTGMDLANQYPTKLSSDVDDKTLGAVLTTVENLIEKQSAPVPPGAGLEQKKPVKQIQYLLVYDPVLRTFERERFGRL